MRLGIVLLLAALGYGIVKLSEFFAELTDRREQTRAARRAAARLGFRVSTDGEAISGGVRGFQVTLRRVGNVVSRPDAHRLIITVDGGGAIPRDLALGTESGDPEFFNGMSGVPTGDLAFDHSVRIGGDEATALASLDASTRRMIRAKAASLENLQVQDGVLTIRRKRGFGGSDLVAAVKSAVELAEHLTLPENEVPARLLRRVTDEPEASGRRALELLQVRFPEHSVTRKAVRAALASPAPELRLAAARYGAATARHLGEQGLVQVREILESEEVREIVESETVLAELWLAGLVHYALAARVPEAVALIGRVGLWLEAGTAFDAETDLPAEAAEQLAGIDDAAREPVLLALLARAPGSVKMAAARGLGRIGTVAAVAPLVAYRDGADWSGDPERVAREAIAQIQARLGVEAGRLSVAAPSAGAGGLTVAEPDPAGRVSPAGEAPAANRPVRRGQRGAKGVPADT